MIASGQGDTAELLSASGGGLAVEPGDASGLAETIKFLFQNPGLRHRMGKSANQWFRDHVSVERACQTIRGAIYGELAAIESS